MMVAGGNDRSAGDADSAVPNTGGGFVNLRDVTIVMECKSAIITAQEVTAETAQVAYIVVQIRVGGSMSPFPVVRWNVDNGGGGCRVDVLLRSGWGGVDWRGEVDR